MSHTPVTPLESPPLQSIETKSRKWYRLPKVLSPSPKPKSTESFWPPTFRLGSFKTDSRSSSDASSAFSYEEEIEDSLGGDLFDDASDKDAPLVELEEHTGQEKFASLMSQDSLREALNDPSKVAPCSNLQYVDLINEAFPVGLAKFGAFLASELGAEQLCFWLVRYRPNGLIILS